MSIDPAATGSPTMRVQTCTKTVMDTTYPDITFDEEGVCNYWHEWQSFQTTLPGVAQKERLLEAQVARIKREGEGKPYDSVIGLSGGVDSSYLAWLAKTLGLRPLAVHFDNGWNTELAVANIEQLIFRLNYDLETFVMDWEEFRDLQRAYFKASVIDLEIPTDHMIFGALHRIAARRGIRTILAGGNMATEWLLPKRWHYRKFDFANIKAIHAAHGELPMKKLPALGVWHQSWYYHVKRIRSVYVLDMIDYNKAEAKRHLTNELGWRDYGGKHHESIFTRFYQGHILPRKWNVDKRKAHWSSLILSGQATREEALRDLQQPTYDEDLQQQDKAYVAKKLGFTDAEFDAVLKLPNRDHEEFGTDRAQREFYFGIARRWGRLRSLMRVS